MKVWNYDAETEANTAHLNGTDLASYPDKESQMTTSKIPKICLALAMFQVLFLE